jgi:hypothetical protein
MGNRPLVGAHTEDDVPVDGSVRPKARPRLGLGPVGGSITRVTDAVCTPVYFLALVVTSSGVQQRTLDDQTFYGGLV